MADKEDANKRSSYAAKQEGLKALVLEAALKIVPFEGWTSKMMSQAAKAAKLDPSQIHHLFPKGALDLIAFWSARMDRESEEKLKSLNMTDMRIRDKITQAVHIRLRQIDGHELAMKRALSRLALPDAHIGPSAGVGLKQLWDSADMIWRAIGDTSTDSNYYSKRSVLSAVLSSSTLSWISDDSPDKEVGKAFLDDRIENVMTFEKTKWAVKSRLKNTPNPAEILGRLRYGKPFQRRRRSHASHAGRYRR